MKLGAVILAAGAGMRLGGVAKALLATRDGRSFLACIVETARAVGVDDVVVVVAPPHEELVAMHARELGARVARNAEPERGMASSIAIGFSSIGERASDAAWLWPVDHPDVTIDTLCELIAALPGHDAARPLVNGSGGHPPLVARALFAALAGCDRVDGGARAVLAGARTIDVPVGDAGCVRDVDTAADLEALT